MKKFEVPYNFDKKILQYYADNKDYISYIFVAAFSDDCYSSNRDTYDDDEICIMPKTRELYESHLISIRDSGLDFCVLWQEKDHLLSNNLLDYYINLGCKGFMVSSNDNAAIIKKYDPSLLVISSITRHLYKGITNEDFSNYDFVVLAHPFNRSLDAIKKLNYMREKLILLVNTACHTDCYSPAHWFNPKFDAVKNCKQRENVSKTCFIPPNQLYIFDQYIGGYKLLGREFTTKMLIEECEMYFHRDYKKGMFKKWLEEGIAQQQAAMTLEQYYNTKTRDIIDIL